MGKRHIPIVATLVVLAAVAVMVRLGFWQLDRLEQKEALLADFNRNSGIAEVIDLQPGNADQLLYRMVRIDCANPQARTAIAGRNDRDQTGYVHQFTCRSGGMVAGFDGFMYQPAIFAVIGWSQGPAPVEFAGGEIEGTLVRAGRDFRVVSNKPIAGLRSNARPDPNVIPNNHLAYAGQWFFFALTALLIYGLALRRKWKSDEAAAQGE